jgi:hypothetical protein
MSTIIRYASLTVNNEEIYGTAEMVCGSGYLFRADGERRAVLVSYKDVNLMLYGLVVESDMQHDVDLAVGGAAAVACSREMGVN